MFIVDAPAGLSGCLTLPLWHTDAVESRGVHAITTGGTIDKQYFDALSQYQITDTIVTKLLSIARVTHPFVVEEVLRKDSIDLTDEDRTLIVEQVIRASCSRVVITHG